MPPSATQAAVYIQTVKTSAWIHELWIKMGGCRDLEFLINPSLSLSKSLQVRKKVTSTLAWTFQPNLKLSPGTVWAIQCSQRQDTGAGSFINLGETEYHFIRVAPAAQYWGLLAWS